ncbi:MAG TPA: hypothetical protein VFP84_34495 [Kofleriaceae bacterium]|nr:hypothetical protein [Kofleriaceae bacterium]
MRQVLPLVLLAPALAGCSLIYNPNNLPAAGSITDAEIILDADPSKLELDGVAPGSINEGQGDGNSALALVVINGHQIVDANTTVELAPSADTPMPAGAMMPTIVGAPVIAKDGNWIALQIAAHVDPMLGDGQLIKLDIRVSQDVKATPGVRNTQTLTGKLTLRGLPELVIAAGTTAVPLDTGTLKPLYSMIDLEAPVTFTGANRAILRATSSITTKALTADGKPGGDAAAASPWVGGCGGGGQSAQGLCSGGTGGQSSGLNGGGGGGGGFATDGMAGKPPSNGSPGVQTGDELIVSYDGSVGKANKSEGGGGGGPATLLGLGLTRGGAGGGGGGAIELTADGDVTVGGAISAKGGAGEKTGAGGGGGGAGGLVMLRAGHALSAPSGIVVSGGPGGATSGSNGAGGDGAAGRVRWDAVTGDAPAAVTAGSFRRGPAFSLGAYVLRDNKPSFTVVGSSNTRFTVYTTNFDVDGHQNTTVGGVQQIDGGSATFSQVLQQGLTKLCLTLEGGASNTPEADKCVLVAFLP